jgi:hypothetical protein
MQKVPISELTSRAKIAIATRDITEMKTVLALFREMLPNYKAGVVTDMHQHINAAADKARVPGGSGGAGARVAPEASGSGGAGAGVAPEASGSGGAGAGVAPEASGSGGTGAGVAPEASGSGGACAGVAPEASGSGGAGALGAPEASGSGDAGGAPRTKRHRKCAHDADFDYAVIL